MILKNVTLKKIDRRDGVISESFQGGTREFAEEYSRIRSIFSDELGNSVDRDFESALRSGQFATAGFAYKLEG